MHDVTDSNDKDHYIFVNHVKLDGEFQQKFGTKDHDEEFKMEWGVSSLINIAVNV